MKKFWTALLAAALLLVTACSGSSGGNEATTAGSLQGSSDPGTTGAQKLTVWCWDPTFNVYAMNEAAKIYQQTHPEFVLEVIEVKWDDVQTKLTTAATSGKLDTLPDILLMQDNAFQKNYTNYPEVFTDLTDSNIAFDEFAEAKVAYSQVEGKNFGVPFDNGASILCLRTDVLKEAGLTIEDFTDITWDTFISLGEEVLAKTNKPLLSTQAGTPDLIMQILQSSGSSLFKADGSTNFEGNDSLKKAVEIYVDLVKKGIMVEVNDWDQYIGTLNNSTVAGTLNGCWILGSIQAANDQSGLWGLTNIPKLDGVNGATNYSNNGGSSWVITSNCKDVALATDFFRQTFAGSVPLYEQILPSSGALSTWLPAAESKVYAEPSTFFGGQKIFLDITDFASKVPKNITGAFYYEARDAVGVALTNIISGGNIETELKAAEENVIFQMQG